MKGLGHSLRGIRRRSVFGILIALSLWVIGFLSNMGNSNSFQIGRLIGFLVFGFAFVFAFLELTENLNLSPVSRILSLLLVSNYFIYPAINLITAKLEFISLLGVSDRITKGYIIGLFFDFYNWKYLLIQLLSFTIGCLIIWFNGSLNPRIRNFFLIWINTFVVVNGWRLLFIISVFNLPLFFGVSLIFFIVDSLGYFGGRLLGGRLITRPLAKKISPQKTWEGFLLSILGGGIISWLVFYLVKIDLSLVGHISLTLLLPLLAVVGDLSFSLLKRKLLLSDFDDIIPGHGGINDRFDSAYFVLVGLAISFYLF